MMMVSDTEEKESKQGSAVQNEGERQYEEEEESETGVTPRKRLRQGGGQESQ